VWPAGVGGPVVVPQALGRSEKVDTMTYVLKLPNLAYPTLNTRRSKLYDGGSIKEWRTAAWAAAREANVPPMTFPTVRLHFYPGDNRRRDRINLALVHKAVVDGLVDAGVLTDDSPEHVEEMMPTIHKGTGQRRWELHVSEAPDEAF
jgi:crossover junction endodeoxyribonuclease RusA